MLEPKNCERCLSTTFSDLEKVNSSPIDGYEHAPLQTLEEATEGICTIVPDLKRHVAKAKHNCKKDSDKLTLDESAAIYLYTMAISFFSHLNKALRIGDREALKPWFPFLKLFITALQKLPSQEIPVWRAVSQNAPPDFKAGEIFFWWCFNSCAKAVDVLKAYLGPEGTIFAIQAISGKDISLFSAFPEEGEIILLPGTCLRMQSNALPIGSRFFILTLQEMSWSSTQRYV